jgi:predicted DNA-binding helix-hairpin-helix protein
MNLEPAEDVSCPKHTQNSDDIKNKNGLNISQAVLPNGNKINLLKTLLTSACERNCFYCPFRAGRNFRRITFKPAELAKDFMDIFRAGVAEGIFLSSGVAGGSLRTQDQLLAVAEILRKKFNYQGYLHLKLMPGAEFEQVKQAMRLANRVSLNLEAPNEMRLQKLAPGKNFLNEILKPLQWVEDIRKDQPGYLGWNGRWPSVTTQFVVGAVGENDVEILSATHYLYKSLRLARAYYSAFSPIEDTPFENQEGESPVREHRLYQASFLLRDYGFNLEELPYDSSGFLPKETDPKLAWARQNLIHAPMEINQASPNDLLRIPGIGPKGAAAILKARQQTSLKDLSQLSKLGVNTQNLAPFILLNGRQPATQIRFW